MDYPYVTHFIPNNNVFGGKNRKFYCFIYIYTIYKKVVGTYVDDVYMEHIFCWASLSYITNIFLNLERNCCLVVKVLCIQYFKQVDQRNIFIWRGRTLGSIHSSGDYNQQPIETGLKAEEPTGCKLRNKATKEHLEPTRADIELRGSRLNRLRADSKSTHNKK